ncbi:hypothetical protein AOR10_24200, partial [Vibrio alginolyticus]
VQGRLQGVAVDGGHPGVEHAGAIQLAENGHDPAGAVHILDMVLLGVGGHLAQLRHLTREAVDIGHGEIDLGLLGGGQQVQDGVGGAAHGDIQGHGVLERRLGADGTRQQVRLVALVDPLGQFDDAMTRGLEQAAAVGVGGNHGAIARQCQAQRFHQAVHGVGGEHAGTGAAGGTSAALHLGEGLVIDAVVGCHDHGIHQVEAVVEQLGLARLHGAAGDEDHRDVQAHGGVEHPGG